MKLTKMILDEMNNIGKNQKKFFTILMQTIVSMYGHVNFTSLSRYSGLSEKTFRRWFQISGDAELWYNFFQGVIKYVHSIVRVR
jgi:hypothetical protein